MKVLPERAELLHAGRRTDREKGRHDEVNS